MITRIAGHLSELTDSSASLEVGGITYELALPSGLLLKLRTSGATGQQITFHTMYYIESGDKRAALFPRLVGFDNPIDREFFQVITSVQGMGVRKALKSLTLSTAEIASAIELKQSSRLATLPGIGKKMAERIITELHGKAAKFALSKTAPSLVADVQVTPRVRDDVLLVLEQLQYGRVEAEAMIDDALSSGIPLQDVESFLQELFKRSQRR